MKKTEIAAEVDKRLALAVPNPRIELDFESPWQLLIATILSAQSTDKRVNQVTPGLFAKYPTPAALAKAKQADVEPLIRLAGFYTVKGKTIRAAAQTVVDKFGGKVPKTLEELVEIPGVARKTANVVLASAFGVGAGIIVDRHVIRVAGRLGLTKETEAPKVERDLMKLFPEKRWIPIGLSLVLHGRYVCTARNPKCAMCPLNEVCPSREAKPVGTVEERAARERVLVESRGEAPMEGEVSAPKARRAPPAKPRARARR